MALYGLNLLWVRTLTPLFTTLPVKALYAALLDGVLKTCVLLAIGVVAVYYWKISPEVNSLIDKVLKRT